MLPQPKPRAVREHLIVPPIGSREIARAQRSGVRRGEDALQPIDFSYRLLGVHSVPISNMGVAIVKRSGICMSCLPPRQRSLLGNAPLRDEINCEAPQPMTTLIVFASHRSQSGTSVLPGCRQYHRQTFVAFWQTRSDAL
jgi:hypothetical protein